MVELTELAETLRSLDATGPNGFEGLVALALSDVSGLSMRLAASGSQFGRDASSEAGAFAIAMEAKRYVDAVRLEDVAGKVALASSGSMSGALDLWVLCATSQVPDDVARRVVRLGEERGLSVLVVDWSEHDLPRLAVLLAAAREGVVEWLTSNRPKAAPTADKILRSVYESPQYERCRQELLRSVSAAEVGLDAVRRRSAEWLRARFSDRRLSQEAFGQYITVAEPASRQVPRTDATARLTGAMSEVTEQPGLIAVLGEEGTGKTWLVASAVMQVTPEPIVLFVAGRRGDSLDPQRPLHGIADLLADEGGGTCDHTGWVRRLERWRLRPAPRTVRFIVVLDGLNERPRVPWADIAKSFMDEVHRLGGRLVVTSRPAFWQREVRNRLGDKFDIREIRIHGYSDPELESVLATVGRRAEGLTPDLRAFVRNPRVCSVAIRLLARLEAGSSDLTVERLLFEYWRARVEERGNLMAHNDVEFHKLLMSHARALRARPRAAFDRDDWTQHSGVAKRAGPQQAEVDLTEIEEGRFLQTAGGDRYEFRRETVPFALGLLLIEEVRGELGEPHADADEAIARAVEAVSGFDVVGKIVGAAAGLSCLDESYPALGRAALVRAWLQLQNLGEDDARDMLAYLPVRPDAFLDSLEFDESTSHRNLREELVVRLLAASRRRRSVDEALRARIPRWLSTWSRRARDWYGRSREELATRQADRDRRIAVALGALAPNERALWERLTIERERPSAVPLDIVAARLIAGGAQAPFAEGLVAWALVRAVGHDSPDAWLDLSWAVRLNRADHDATRAAVRSLVESLGANLSGAVRRAAATALDLAGDLESSTMAAALEPPPTARAWRSVERYCETNPLDPAAPPGERLDAARTAVHALAPDTVWCAFSTTMEDHVLEEVTPALARFDTEPLVGLLRRVANTMEHRSGQPARSLGWRLPRISPLFGDEETASLARALDAFLSNPSLLPPDSPDFVLAKIASALLPHLEPAAQIDVLGRLPMRVPTYVFLARALRKAAPELVARRLREAVARSDHNAIRWTLVFAAWSGSVPTDELRSSVVRLTTSAEPEVAAAAWNVVYAARDAALDAAAIEVATLAARPPDAKEEFCKARAIARAIVDRGRDDLLDMVAPQFLGYAAAERDGEALERAARAIEAGLGNLLRPLTARLPDARLSVHVDGRGLESRTSVEDERIDDSWDAGFRRLSDPEAARQRDAERQRELAEASDRFEDDLAAEGAAILEHPPLPEVCERLARHHPSRVSRWLDLILTVREGHVRGQVRNLGVLLASAFGARDPRKAADVIRLLLGERSPVILTYGGGRIELLAYALFRAHDVPALDEFRVRMFDEALDDAAIEAAVVAAERSGAGAWLASHVDRLTGSRHPHQQALAVTIAGFREPAADSDPVLERDWGPAFLGWAAEAARKAARHARWARHWFDCARTSESPSDFWRFSELALELTDWRFLAWDLDDAASPHLSRFGGDLRERLRRSAEKRTDKRRRTLFGAETPSSELVERLRARDAARPLADVV